MKKVKVGVAGYGTIGQRLADGVAMQEDMELVGIADLAPTLSIQALRENNMVGANGVTYNLYLVNGADSEAFAAKKIPVAGSFEDLVKSVDIMLDSSPAGVGAKNRELYTKLGVKAIFQGGEKNDVANVFFHGCANYEKGLDQDYLKLTSCNTTGLIRTVDCLNRAYGIARVAITIIRRVADPGDYHRGLTNALQIDKAPTHQAIDLMTVMPDIDATGILVHTPVTHGHIITVLASGKNGEKITREMALEAFAKHPRIRTVTTDAGFKGNASFFKYARDLGNRRGDMYEVGLWEDSIVESGNDIMYAVNIPQESVTIPETIDGIRAALHMQEHRSEALAATNRFLKIGRFKQFQE
jgi:glyceraldehyde-3-phosphate dehydrogenase, type II